MLYMSTNILKGLIREMTFGISGYKYLAFLTWDGGAYHICKIEMGMLRQVDLQDFTCGAFWKYCRERWDTGTWRYNTIDLWYCDGMLAGFGIQVCGDQNLNRALNLYCRTDQCDRVWLLGDDEIGEWADYIKKDTEARYPNGGCPF